MRSCLSRSPISLQQPAQTFAAFELTEFGDRRILHIGLLPSPSPYLHWHEIFQRLIRPLVVLVCGELAACKCCPTASTRRIWALDHVILRQSAAIPQKMCPVLGPRTPNFLVHLQLSAMRYHDKCMKPSNGSCKMATVTTVHEGWWGTLGPEIEVDSSRRVIGMKARLEAVQNSGDDTALNGIILRERSFTDSNDEQDRTVENGLWGDWTAWSIVPNDHYICGLEVRMEPVLGSGQDDTAMNGIRLYHCPKGGDPLNDRAMMEVTVGHWGTWQGIVMVESNFYLAGLQTRFESPLGSGGDDTALNGIRMITRQLPADWQTGSHLHIFEKSKRMLGEKVAASAY